MRKKQQEAEAAQKAITDKELKAQARESTIAAYISDSESIIALLGTLPEADYDKYFNEVSEFTGYYHRIGLYSHLKLNLDSSHPLAQRTEEISAQLTGSLQARNITVSKVGHQLGFGSYEYSEEGRTIKHEFHLGTYGHEDFSLVYLPEKEFLDGGYVHHYGYEHPEPHFDMRGMHEPRLPGIGIQFFRYGSLAFSADSHDKEKGYGNWTTTTHRSVYFRILPNTDFIMTGASRQKKDRLTSFKKLDDGLEQVIAHPLIYTKREFNRKYFDYGGD